LGGIRIIKKKILLAGFGKDLRDRATFAALDLVVQVQERATEAFGYGPAHRRLSRSGKPDEDDVWSRWISDHQAGLRRAKDRRHSSAWSHRASPRRISREARRPGRARAFPPQSPPWRAQRSHRCARPLLQQTHRWPRQWCRAAA